MLIWTLIYKIAGIVSQEDYNLYNHCSHSEDPKVGLRYGGIQSCTETHS